MSELPGTRDDLVTLKWCVVAAAVALIALQAMFYLPLECRVEWAVLTGLVVALIYRSADNAACHAKDNGRDGYRWHAPTQERGRLPGLDLVAGGCEL